MWPENWPVIQLFRQMATQWRVSASGPTGLDYQTLFAVMDRQGLTGDEWKQMFEDIRVCEASALDEMFAR